LRAIAILALFIGTTPLSFANGCIWSHIDQNVDRNESGMWNPSVYRGVLYTLSAADVAGALWEGDETLFGRTLWQAFDAELLSTASAAIGKYAFSRVRPSEGDDPCRWFEGGSNYSFPSGEAAASAGLIAPFILQYAREQPLIAVLALVPLYVGAGRVKNHEHWQTDVLAGWAIGGATGWYATRREVPLTVEMLPGGIAIGLRKRI
jgi:membrane-associated phospholipid phosphatase